MATSIFYWLQTQDYLKLVPGALFYVSFKICLFNKIFHNVDPYWYIKASNVFIALCIHALFALTMVFASFVMPVHLSAVSRSVSTSACELTAGACLVAAARCHLRVDWSTYLKITLLRVR